MVTGFWGRIVGFFLPREHGNQSNFFHGDVFDYILGTEQIFSGRRILLYFEIRRQRSHGDRILGKDRGIFSS